jgi:hypothetical protein
MLTLVLLLFIFAGAVCAGTVISACALAGRIDSDQAAVALGETPPSTRAVLSGEVSHSKTNRAPALTA